MTNDRATMSAFSAWLLLLSGCPGPGGSAEDGGVDAGQSLSPVELCNRLSAAHCRLLQRCYPAFARDSLEDCLRTTESRCLDDYQALRPSFDRQAVEIDVAKVIACEERMRHSSCPPTFPPGYPARVARPFSDCTLRTGLLRGKVPAGQTCDDPVECAPSTVCIKPGGVCRGTCSTYPKEGEPCAFGCGPGLYCDTLGTPSTSDDRCFALKGVNEPCADSGECREDLWCRSGYCRPRGKLNEPCAYDPLRLSTCEAGLACDVVPFVDGLTGTCIKPLEASQPCRFHWSCAAGLVCMDIDWTGFPDRAPSPGLCAPPMPAGANCPFTLYSSFVGDQCQSGHYCEKESGKCAAVPRLGESCTPSAPRCSGGEGEVFCKPISTVSDQGICSRPPNVGERCAFAVDQNRKIVLPCASGWCDEESTLSCLAPNKQVGQICQSDGECVTNRCAVQEDRTQKCAPACP